MANTWCRALAIILLEERARVVISGSPPEVDKMRA
jgi:hypothetical protein